MSFARKSIDVARIDTSGKRTGNPKRISAVSSSATAASPTATMRRSSPSFDPSKWASERRAATVRAKTVREERMMSSMMKSSKSCDDGLEHLFQGPPRSSSPRILPFGRQPFRASQRKAESMDEADLQEDSRFDDYGHTFDCSPSYGYDGSDYLGDSYSGGFRDDVDEDEVRLKFASTLRAHSPRVGSNSSGRGRGGSRSGRAAATGQLRGRGYGAGRSLHRDRSPTAGYPGRPPDSALKSRAGKQSVSVELKCNVNAGAFACGGMDTASNRAPCPRTSDDEGAPSECKRCGLTYLCFCNDAAWQGKDHDGVAVERQDGHCSEEQHDSEFSLGARGGLVSQPVQFEEIPDLFGRGVISLQTVDAEAPDLFDMCARSNTSQDVEDNILAGGTASAEFLEEIDDRILCPHCGRKYNEQVAERHIAKCAHIVAKPKALRKGTGLERNAAKRASR